MKILYSLLAIAVLGMGVGVCADTEAPAEAPIAAVIKGRALWSPSSDSVKQIFESHFGWEVREIQLADLGHADFIGMGIQLVYFPGGEYVAMRLPPNGKENLSRAIGMGMGYIGTCGGALIMARNTPRGDTTGIFPGEELFGGGFENREYFFDIEHPLVKLSSQRDRIKPVMTINYNGGPSDFMLDPKLEGCYQNLVLARHEYNDKPAIVTFRHGLGAVMLISPHPERPLTLPAEVAKAHEVIILGAEWVAGTYASRVKNEIAPVVTVPEAAAVGESIECSVRGTKDEQGLPLGYIWDWGDGSPWEYTPVATHTYKAPGTYTILLRITDGTELGLRRIEKTISVAGEGEEGLPACQIIAPFPKTRISGEVAVFRHVYGMDKVKGESAVFVRDGKRYPVALTPQLPLYRTCDTTQYDDGDYTLALTVTDESGAECSASIPITIANHAPEPPEPAMDVYIRLKAAAESGAPEDAAALAKLIRQRAPELLQTIGKKSGARIDAAKSTWDVLRGWWLPTGDGALAGYAFSESYAGLAEPLPDSFRMDLTMSATDGPGPEVSFWFAGNKVKRDGEGYFIGVGTGGVKLQRMGKTILSLPAPTTALNETHTLTVMRDGGRIQAFWDGAAEPFLEFADPEPLAGEGHRVAGVYVWNGTILVESIQVESLAE